MNQYQFNYNIFQKKLDTMYGDMLNIDNLFILMKESYNIKNNESYNAGELLKVLKNDIKDCDKLRQLFLQFTGEKVILDCLKNLNQMNAMVEQEKSINKLFSKIILEINKSKVN